MTPIPAGVGSNGGGTASLFDPPGGAARTPSEQKQGYAEPRYAFLNRCTRPEFERVRCLLEDWYTRYPQSARAHLVSRFRNRDDQPFDAAFFELYLHELLLCMGLGVEVLDTGPNPNPRPDFRVTDSGGDTYFLEAAVLEPSDKAVSSEKRKETAYDVFDRLHHPNFFLDLHTVSGVPSESPGVSAIRKDLWRRLDALDPDNVELGWQNAPKCVPVWRYDLSGWAVEVRPIPRSRASRHSPPSGSIGMIGYGVVGVDSGAGLRETIHDKGTKYGQAFTQLVIAINDCREHQFDQIDLEETLLGEERFERLPATGEIRMIRRPNGEWVGPGAVPRMPGVLGLVLFRSRLLPTTVASAEPFLLENEGANGRVSDRGWLLERVAHPTDKDRPDPIPVHALLNLPQDWPF